MQGYANVTSILRSTAMHQYSGVTWDITKDHQSINVFLFKKEDAN